MCVSVLVRTFRAMNMNSLCAMPVVMVVPMRVIVPVSIPMVVPMAMLMPVVLLVSVLSGMHFSVQSLVDDC